MSERPRIVDLVFARRDGSAHRRTAIAIVAAIALYGLIAAWLILSEPPLADWGAELALRVHAELMREQSVELEPPKPPPEPPKPLPEPPKPPPEVAKAPAPRHASSAPPPPAQAGRVVSQEPDPKAPVDLTGNTFETGTAKTYAGGVTTSSGTNTTAAHTRDVDPHAPPHVQARTPDRSSTVLLRNPDWTCPWPAEAEAEQIDHQIAMVRVVVAADGQVVSATILSDPGHGFGQAALECARRERFLPARDRDGHPIRSESPPIRVRFTR